MLAHGRGRAFGATDGERIGREAGRHEGSDRQVCRGGDVAARQEPPQLLGDGLVEDRRDQCGRRGDVGHGQRVPQRRDVVVQEHGDPAGLPDHRLAQLLVAGRYEM